ncbi:FBD-associated F-box protein At3g52670-like [Trifolium pratense]|uniref:FBD-associated F-box protein At3g52670-like n=1 Tax=Trifolium pratense TaxID=57577 RepID=UPI001E6957D0|nr:FBD-associated F-box protein At3g52670-like [Trifolium pratense]
MAAESNSKRRRIVAEEDRISSLPDCVLSHILSFLPTKTSVATSILSNRWRHVWKHVSVLDFSNDFRDEALFEKAMRNNKLVEHFQNFSVFVNRVFSLRMPYPIEKMSLSCVKSLYNIKSCTSSIDTWVRSVIGPHLKEFSLEIDPIQKYQFEPPITLFTCTNLVSLSLIGGTGMFSSIYIDPRFAEEIRLPSLNYLKLHMRDVDIHTMNGFLVGCPILETLDTRLFGFNYKKLRVPSTLKRLKISSVGYGCYCLEMDLYSLGFDDLNTFSDVGNLQNVVKASLDVFRCSDGCYLTNKLVSFFNVLSGIKHLSLSISTIELILPWFNQNSLLSLLHACPMLQVLITQNDKKESTSPEWTTQSTVPNCILSHLTYIQFKGYEGCPDELLFAEYILQNGLVLKKMSIADISVDILKYYILRRLSNVPRASRLCQLTFD